MHLAAKVFLILLLNHGAATFDAWSTRYLVGQNLVGLEANPLERPFVHSNVLYLTNQGDAVIADILELHKWKKRKLRIASDFFATLVFSGHLYSGIHNVRLADALPQHPVMRVGSPPIVPPASGLVGSARLGCSLGFHFPALNGNTPSRGEWTSLGFAR